MKKRFLRLSKRILILTLCTTLLSGSVFSKYKITANATAITFGAYSAYEICLYIGGILLATSGAACAYDNRDKIAEVGKNFIDSLNLDDVSGWLLSKVNTTGQSYVYGTEALQEVQEMEFTVIQGGGNMPENNNDNDDDGDIDADDRTKELEQMGMWATTYFVDIIEEGVKPLIEGLRNGEENILSSALGMNSVKFTDDELASYEGWSDYDNLYFDGTLTPDSSGLYHYKSVYYYEVYGDAYRLFYSLNTSDKVAGYYSLGSGITFNKSFDLTGYSKRLPSGSWKFETSKASDGASDFGFPAIYSCNFPIFSCASDMYEYLDTGNFDKCINKAAKVYVIADWLQEHWISTLEQLNTGIRSLNDNMLIVGAAANQALINQSNGLGYIEDLAELISAATPLPLPGTVADPIYYPIDSPVPPLDPGDYPWVDPVPVPDPDPVDPPSGGDDGSITDDDIRGTDSFGISTLFGILILLIMILLMLLMIFLSCLAFIIMIFRIPATTGFLPEEMVAGLDYLKTLEIPGFGMSVYAFFMALIYIILIFTVIGMLRKNIDKIKFPRKGKW